MLRLERRELYARHAQVEEVLPGQGKTAVERLESLAPGDVDRECLHPGREAVRIVPIPARETCFS